MTVVYLDRVFLLNSVVDYLLFLCAARLCGFPLHRRRVFVNKKVSQKGVKKVSTFNTQ